MLHVPGNWWFVDETYVKVAGPAARAWAAPNAGHGEAAGLSLPDHAEQAGLADARLARDKQQPARARRGIGEPDLDERQEGIPAGQNR